MVGKPRSVAFKRYVPARGRADKKKKFVATFFDAKGRKLKSVPFGSRGSSVYFDHKDDRKMKAYLARHSKAGENWRDPMTAGALSRWVLWSTKESLSAGKRKFAARFHLTLK